MRSTSSSYCVLKGKNLPWSAVIKKVDKGKHPPTDMENTRLVADNILTLLKEKPLTKIELCDKSGVPIVDINRALYYLKKDGGVIHTPREKKTESDKLLGCLSKCRPGFYSLNTDRKP